VRAKKTNSPLPAERSVHAPPRKQFPIQWAKRHAGGNVLRQGFRGNCGHLREIGGQAGVNVRRARANEKRAVAQVIPPAFGSRGREITRERFVAIASRRSFVLRSADPAIVLLHPPADWVAPGRTCARQAMGGTGFLYTGQGAYMRLVPSCHR